MGRLTVDRVEVKEGLSVESLGYTVEGLLPSCCETAINRKSTKNAYNFLRLPNTVFAHAFGDAIQRARFW